MQYNSPVKEVTFGAIWSDDINSGIYARFLANDTSDTAIGLVGSRTNLDRCYIRTLKTISILQGRHDDNGLAGIFERELWSETNYSDIVDGSSHIEQNRHQLLSRVYQ